METIAFLIFILLLIAYGSRKFSIERKKRVLAQKELSNSISEVNKITKRLNKILKISDSQQKSLVDANENLEALKIKAEEAVDIKSDFLAKMSHEIRTPMNAILGMLYLINKSNLSKDDANYIKKAEGAANSLLVIINDILDFSKIEANKLEIKNSEFNINDLINDVMDIMSIKAQENKLELLTYYDKELPLNIISDKLRVSQILTNLISNGIKFTKEGEILVSTKLVNKDKNSATLMFCIKDSGIGISKSNQSKLFSEFTQVDNSQTRSFEGTGLGLAICEKLSIMLGGKVWIDDSKEGIGSTFCFTIKVKISNNQQKKEYKFIKETSNLNILVVDDNSMANEVLSKMLKSFNYNIQSVDNGKDAFEHMLKNRYDLVFLDYKMPNMDGLEVYQKVKEKLGDLTPKTIMVTAYSQEVLDKHLEYNGINGFLSKPISPSFLYDKIVEVISHKDISKIDAETKSCDNSNLKGIKVLLVEDNKLNQEFASLMLQNNGLIVEIASDGIEALQKIKSKFYDIVLMDIQMPLMDGIEATKHIREFEDDYFKDIPIIALSANALVGDRDKSLKAGMNEHITKPINPKKLFKTMKKFLNLKDDLSNETSTTNQTNYKYINQLPNSIFEIKEAMYRINGNETAYIKILKQFSKKYINVIDDIEELILNNKTKELEAKVHELKGISGNISANQLFSILNSIDLLLKQNTIPPKEMFEDLKTKFYDVFYAISNLQMDNNSDTISFDKKKVKELLTIILENLDSDIVKCSENMVIVLPYLESNHKEFSNILANALDEFDTDTAEELIKKFLEDLKSED
ncbi:MAG: response regulator [Campylobacterota bacterium]|nr:response regulator [Campylobacterota bacterium]